MALGPDLLVELRTGHLGVPLEGRYDLVWRRLREGPGASGGLLENPLTGLKVALALPVIAALLTLGALGASVVQWRTGAGTRGARLRYAATVLVAVLFIWSLNQWNLLGWRM